MDSIRNEETAIGEYERCAEQSRMEAKARYLDWVNEEDEKSGLSFRFEKTSCARICQIIERLLMKRVSLDGLFSCDLSTLSDRSLRKDVNRLNRARSSFKDYLFQDPGVRHIILTALDHFGGIDQISSHSLYIIKML